MTRICFDSANLQVFYNAHFSTTSFFIFKLLRVMYFKKSSLVRNRVLFEKVRVIKRDNELIQVTRVKEGRKNVLSFPHSHIRFQTDIICI